MHGTSADTRCRSPQWVCARPGSAWVAARERNSTIAWRCRIAEVRPPWSRRRLAPRICDGSNEGGGLAWLEPAEEDRSDTSIQATTVRAKRPEGERTESEERGTRSSFLAIPM